VSPRALIIILGVLLLLYLVAVAAGLSARGNDVDLEGGLLRILERGIGKQPLAEDDLALVSPQGCLGLFREQALQLPAGSTCQFLVDRAEGRLPSVRVLRVQLSAGSRAEVVLQQPEQVTLRQRMDSNTPRHSVDLHREGGLLLLGCFDTLSAGCRLDLLP
jgi:hypothetical protein